MPGTRRTKARRLQELMYLFGLIDRLTCAGIQFDLMGETIQTPEGNLVSHSRCQYDCTEQNGGYHCGSAKTYRPTGKSSGLIEVTEALAFLRHGVDGMRMYIDHLVKNILPRRFKEMGLNVHAQKAIVEHLLRKIVEINIFGGNPELHKMVITLIAALREQFTNVRITLTTTGGMLLNGSDFAQRFFEYPPDVLAVSGDDLTPAQLSRLSKLSLDKLKAAHNGAKPLAQHAKAIAAIAAAKLTAEHGKPAFLINMVVSSKNIGHIIALMEEWHAAFPHAIINPYFEQSGFAGGAVTFSRSQIQKIRELIAYMIKANKDGVAHFPRRLHFWILQDAICRTFADSPTELLRRIVGYKQWYCYGEGTRYLQLAAKQPLVTQPLVQIGGPPQPVSLQESVANMATCYWHKSAVSSNRPIESSDEVFAYMRDMHTSTRSTQGRCPGCGMGRLVYDLVNLRVAVDERLRAEFDNGMRQHVPSIY